MATTTTTKVTVTCDSCGETIQENPGDLHLRRRRDPVHVHADGGPGPGRAVTATRAHRGVIPQKHAGRHDVHRLDYCSVACAAVHLGSM